MCIWVVGGRVGGDEGRVVYRCMVEGMRNGEVEE